MLENFCANVLKPGTWPYIAKCLMSYITNKFGVKTCEGFLCFGGIVRLRVYYVDFFVFFVLCHW